MTTSTGMKLVRTASLALSLLGVAVTSQAKIGWTLERYQEAYGNETEVFRSPEDGREVHHFLIEGIHIYVAFDAAGKVDHIEYTPVKGRFSLDTLHQLLEANSGGFEWDFAGKKAKDGVRYYIRWYAYQHGRKMMDAEYEEAGI
jgi:hypothetical protein